MAKILPKITIFQPILLIFFDFSSISTDFSKENRIFAVENITDYGAINDYYTHSYPDFHRFLEYKNDLPTQCQDEKPTADGENLHEHHP